jgi:hypothetical protein
MSGNRRYSIQENDQYTLEEYQPPKRDFETLGQKAHDMKDMRSTEDLEKYLLTLSPEERRNYLVEQVERTFTGKKLRMFHKQLDRQSSIEEKNMELMQIN